MVCCGLGDPCVSQVQAGLTGDESTENMRLLLKLAHNRHSDAWISKAEITELVERLSEGDAFVWFDPTQRSHQTRFGKELVRFVGRELGGYRLERDGTDRSRPRFRVTLIQNLASEGPSLRTCEPCEPPAPSSTVASGQKNHHPEGVCEPCEPQTQFLRDDSGGRMMPFPVDDGANPPLKGAKQVRKVRMDESTETGRERLSRLCPVREMSQSFSA